jgi:hypothetical protein
VCNGISEEEKLHYGHYDIRSIVGKTISKITIMDSEDCYDDPIQILELITDQGDTYVIESDRDSAYMAFSLIANGDAIPNWYKNKRDKAGIL